MVLQGRHRRPTGKSTRAIAKRALRIAKSDVAELKAHTVTDINSGTVAAVWVINRVSTPAQGSAANQRDGDVVQNMSIQFQGNLTQHASATDTQFRVVIVQDRQGNGIAAPVLSIFNENNMNSLYTFTAGDRKRFKILYDRVYTMDAAGKTNHYMKVFKRLSGRQTYNLGTDSTASLGKNSVLICFCSNEATNVPAFDIDSRFVWRDV